MIHKYKRTAVFLCAISIIFINSVSLAAVTTEPDKTFFMSLYDKGVLYLKSKVVSDEQFTKAQKKEFKNIDNIITAIGKGASTDGDPKDKISAIALSYISLQFPAINPVLKLFGSSNTGPSELDIAVEKIISAVQNSEVNIIAAINMQAKIRNEADLITVTNQTRTFFTVWLTDSARETNFLSLLNVSADTENLIHQFDLNTTIHDPYDTYHTYLGIVAAFLQQQIEISRLTTISEYGGVQAVKDLVANMTESEKLAFEENLSNEIKAQIRLMMETQLFGGGLLEHFYSIDLNNGWRKASNRRFTPYYPAGTTTYPANTYMINKQLGDYNIVEVYPGLLHTIEYELEGVKHQIKWVEYTVGYQNAAGEMKYPEVVAIFGHQGNLLNEFICSKRISLGYITHPCTDIKSGEVGLKDVLVQEKIDKYYNEHRDVEYWAYLKRVYEPSVSILNSWISLTQQTTAKKWLQADTDLANIPRVIDTSCGTFVQRDIQYVQMQTQYDFVPCVDTDNFIKVMPAILDLLLS